MRHPKGEWNVREMFYMGGGKGSCLRLERFGTFPRMEWGKGDKKWECVLKVCRRVATYSFFSLFFHKESGYFASA